MLIRLYRHEEKSCACYNESGEIVDGPSWYGWEYEAGYIDDGYQLVHVYAIICTDDVNGEYVEGVVKCI